MIQSRRDCKTLFRLALLLYLNPGKLPWVMAALALCNAAKLPPQSLTRDLARMHHRLGSGTGLIVYFYEGDESQLTTCRT